MAKFYFSYLACFLLFSNLVVAQQMQKPSSSEIAGLSQWAQLMYAKHPNVFEVSEAYQNYYRTHAFEKSYHTQYYKRWMRQNQYFTNESGFVITPTQVQIQNEEALYLKKQRQQTNVKMQIKSKIKLYKRDPN